MTRFWISWEEPGEDSRPIKHPPPPQVKAWWESGFSDDCTNICAVIDVEDVGEIQEALNGYWEPRKWRFIEVQDPDWRPSPGRFPWPKGEEYK